MRCSYLVFKGQASSSYSRLDVPDTDFGAANVDMVIRIQFFGKGNVYQQIPALQMSYRRIPKPGTTEGSSIATSGRRHPLILDTAVSLPAYSRTRESNAFEVERGDTVLVTISRPSGGTYPEVGLLRIAGILKPRA
jgi:hypothetical protein